MAATFTIALSSSGPGADAGSKGKAGLAVNNCNKAAA